MIKGERQITQSIRKPLCARSITASCAALKKVYGFLKRQHVKRDLIC